jgi:hypothetical protein
MERLKLQTTNRTISVLKYWNDELLLELSPPYQRGDVWGETRQRNLIKSLLIGIPIASLIVNDRWAAQWSEKFAVIDGKQRITAILKFFNNELRVPAEWFDLDLEGDIVYSDLPINKQRFFSFLTIGISEGALPSIEAEREVFELVNFGGVAQGDSDL